MPQPPLDYRLYLLALILEESFQTGHLQAVRVHVKAGKDMPF